MNEPSKNPDTELDKTSLEYNIIMPLSEYVSLSNIIFVDFHGQEDGEDPEHDKLTARWLEARAKLYVAIQAYSDRLANKRALEARIDELEKLLHKGVCEVMCGWSKKCDIGGENCVRIRKRIAELQSQINPTELEPDVPTQDTEGGNHG